MNTTCDVLVVGGGVAGVPAAVAASRAGARTVLVERESFFGGTGVTALHRYICGLYLNGPAEPTETLNPGLAREVVARLKKLSPASRPLQMGRVWGFPFQPAQLRSVYDDLVQGEANLTRLTSSTVKAVQYEEGHIASVTVQTPDGEQQIALRSAIDATGWGGLIRLSGAPFELAPEPERQLGGCTLHLEGIEGDRELLAIKIAWQLGRLPAAKTNGLPPFAGFAAGCGEHEGFCKFSIPPELARLDEETVHERLAQVHAILAALMPKELGGSRIVGHSRLVEREGIRLAGEWELDEVSVVQGRKFANGVVRNAWPIEFWEPGASGPLYAYPPDGDFYEIPRRCLRSRTVPNLFATGRCISASSKALASTRAMGTCIALGEAAGKLATIYR